MVEIQLRRLHIDQNAPHQAEAEEQEQEQLPTPHASPVVQLHANRSQWDLRLDTLAAEAMMPLTAVNRRQSQRDRAELASHISELKATVEMQGEMLRRLIELTDEKGKHRAHEDGRVWD